MSKYILINIVTCDMEELKTVDSCTFEEHESLTFCKRLLLDDNCPKTHSEALEQVASKGLHSTATSSFPVPQQPRSKL